MKRNFTLLLLLLWSGMGVVWYSDYIDSIKYPDSTMIKRVMEGFYTKAKTQGKFMDTLPVMFRKFPAIGAIFIFNEKKQLIGSLYESERVSRPAYRALLKEKNNMLEKKSLKASVLPVNDKTTAVVFYNRNISLMDVVKDLVTTKPEMKWMISFYFFIVFIMALLLVIFSEKEKRKSGDTQKKHRINLSINEGTTANSYSEDAHLHAEHKPKFIESKMVPQTPESEKVDETEKGSEPFFAEKVLGLMESLEQKYGAVSIGYYFWDGAHYKPVVQKQGGILIRGEALPLLGRSFYKLAQNPRLELIDNSMGMVIPLMYRNALIGILLLDSRVRLEISESEKKSIFDVCSTFAQSIFLHRIYDAATVDPDTDFYTYPYFYFYLKEKLKHSGSFLTFIFEIPELNTISPKTLRVWAKSSLYRLEEENMKPDIAIRMDRNRFVLVFNFSSNKSDWSKEQTSSLRLSNAEKIPGLVENYIREILGIKKPLHGGFFLRPKLIDSVDTFLKRLEYVLVESRLNPGQIATLLDPDALDAIRGGRSALKIN